LICAKVYGVKERPRGRSIHLGEPGDRRGLCATICAPRGAAQRRRAGSSSASPEPYICGMSVPPVMMAQAASEIYKQWLER